MDEYQEREPIPTEAVTNPPPKNRKPTSCPHQEQTKKKETPDRKSDRLNPVRSRLQPSARIEQRKNQGDLAYLDRRGDEEEETPPARLHPFRPRRRSACEWRPTLGSKPVLNREPNQGGRGGGEQGSRGGWETSVVYRYGGGDVTWRDIWDPEEKGRDSQGLFGELISSITGRLRRDWSIWWTLIRPHTPLVDIGAKWVDQCDANYDQ